MRAIYVIGKVLLWVILSVIILVLLLFLAINLPPVQRWLTDQVVSYLDDRIDTEFSIGRVGLQFPSALRLEDVYLEDQQGDTLLYAGVLSLSIHPGNLLSKEIAIRNIQLENIRAHAYPLGDSTMNYQFLIDSLAAPSADTNAVGSLPDTSGAPAWDLLFPNTSVQLSNISLDYLQADSAIEASLRLRSLLLRAHEIDLAEGKIRLQEIDMSGGNMDLRLGDLATSSDTSAAVSYDVAVDQIRFDQVRFRLRQPGMRLAGHIGHAETGNLSFRSSAEALFLAFPELQLSNSQFAYRMPGATQSRGLNYNDIALDSIQLHLKEVSYENGEINAEVENAAAQEQSGLALQRLNGSLQYTPQFIRIRNLDLATRRSSIQAPELYFSLPADSSTQALASLQVDAHIRRASLLPRDLAYFAPQLFDLPAFQASAQETIQLNGRVSGALSELSIPQLQISGWNSRIQARGQLGMVYNPEQLQMNLTIGPAVISRQALQAWLPAGTLPPDMDLPASLEGQARLEGSMQALQFSIQGHSSRSLDPIAGSLDARGIIRNVMDTRRLQYAVEVDTLFTSREVMLAYLPAGALPPYLELPDDVLLRGRFVGSMDSLYTHARLHSLRGGNISHLAVNGYVRGFQQGTSNLYFDIGIDSLKVIPTAFDALLPDTLLPEYVRLPTISSGAGHLRGSPRNLQANLRLQTNFGAIQSRAILKDSSYRLEFSLRKLSIRQLLEPAAYDSLIGRELSPLTIDLGIQGQGLQFKEDMVADIDLRILPENKKLGWNKGVVATGQLVRRSFKGVIESEEPGLSGVIAADLKFVQDTSAFAELQMNIRQIDFQRLGLTEVPALFRGRADLESKGNSLDYLEGRLVMEDLYLRYDTIAEEIKKLELVADLKADSSRVELESDIADGFLRGHFQYPDIVRDVRLFVQSYFNPAISLDSLRREPPADFAFELRLTRPDILTSGLIPGLTELSPVQIRGNYQSPGPSLEVFADVREATYSSFALDSLLLEADIHGDTFTYELGFTSLRFLDSFQIVNLSLQGRVDEGRIINDLQQRDTRGRLRFDLQAALERQEDIISIQLAPEALINYETWQVSQGNRITLEQEDFGVEDWSMQLSNDGQVIRLSDEGGQDLVVEFSRFNLKTLSDIVKYESDYLRGQLNGKLRLDALFNELRIAADLEIDSFELLGAQLGHVEAVARQGDEQRWDAQLRVQGEGHQFSVQGSYAPANEASPFDVQLEAPSIDLANIQPLLKQVFSQMDGKLRGDLAFSGSLEQPRLEGEVQFQNASITPTMLKARWGLDERPLRFQMINRDGRRVPTLRLQQTTLTDPEGNTLTLNGGITLISLQNYGLFLRVAAQDFLVLNTEKGDNDLFYGRLQVDVDGFLGGRLDSAALTLNVAPEEGSSFVYNFPVDQLQKEETGEGIVEFLPPDELESELEEDAVRRRLTTSATNPLGWDMTINASIRESLQIKVITNPITGDNFEGRGTGDLAVRISPRGDINLSGQVEMVEGSYLFTYTELIQREFTVLEGSQISWTGDVNNPQLNARARYATRTAPYPLVSAYQTISDQEESQYRRREEFYVVFGVQGRLEAMDVNIDIVYPRTSLNSNRSTIVSAVNQLNQDETQTNSQAFSLLLFNGFMAPNAMGGSGGGSLEVVNMQQGLSSILNNYLNNFADRYINFVDLDFDIESTGTGSQYFENTDFRVRLQKTFLDERLEISVDGIATGYDNNPSNSQMQAYLDNISVQYALTNDGQLKIRMYNQREIDDFLGTEVVKLGGALVFSRDFKKWQLFARQPAKEE